MFDLSSYDLIIDGKERRNNGKGVRAITHAAFKVALMLFCRERNLPHPGFLVLDTPLLTYRDPMKKPGDRLESDEQDSAKHGPKGALLQSPRPSRREGADHRVRERRSS